MPQLLGDSEILRAQARQQDTYEELSILLESPEGLRAFLGKQPLAEGTRPTQNPERAPFLTSETSEIPLVLVLDADRVSGE